MFTLIQVSDPHLSRSHGFFYSNWLKAAAAIDAARPDLVVASGDLSLNGADSDDDLAFARRCLDRLAAPVLPLPGNHDIGDEPPGQSGEQIIDGLRRQRYLDRFGMDRWVADAGDWRAVGIDAQLCGSGLAAEAKQDEWLAAALAADSRPVILFLHKPLFLDDPDESRATATTLNPEPRHRLLARLAGSNVRIVACGHLHQYRQTIWNGLTLVWGPSTAFLASHDFAGATPQLGYVEYRLDADRHQARFVRLADLEEHDLAALKQQGRYRFLRDMPPCPVGEDAAVG